MISKGPKSSEPPREAGLGRDWGTPQIAGMIVLLSVNDGRRIRPEIDCGASRGNEQTAVRNSRKFNVRLICRRAQLARLQIINEVEHAPSGHWKARTRDGVRAFRFSSPLYEDATSSELRCLRSSWRNSSWLSDSWRRSNSSKPSSGSSARGAG
jgi:hypothetical protein